MRFVGVLRAANRSVVTSAVYSTSPSSAPPANCHLESSGLWFHSHSWLSAVPLNSSVPAGDATVLLVCTGMG